MPVFDPQQIQHSPYKNKVVSAAEAVQLIHDGDTVTVDVNPDVASDGLSVTSEREQKAEN